MASRTARARGRRAISLVSLGMLAALTATGSLTLGTGCGGSSSETPPPLEPSELELERAPSDDTDQAGEGTLLEPPGSAETTSPAEQRPAPPTWSGQPTKPKAKPQRKPAKTGTTAAAPASPGPAPSGPAPPNSATPPEANPAPAKPEAPATPEAQPAAPVKAKPKSDPAAPAKPDAP